MCKITVAIPIYNRESTIEKCINSVINQTYKDFELLLINDGSTDGSESICLDFAQKDNRIRYISGENKGIAYVRNLALKEARGEYLCFVDSDDYIDNDALEFMINSAETEEADIVICGYILEKGKDTQAVVYEGIYPENPLLELKLKNLIDSPCNKLYKLSFLRKTDAAFPDGEYYEDTHYNLSLLPFEPKMTIKQKCFYHYVHNMGSITRRYNVKKLYTIKKRAKLFKQVTNGIEAFCDYNYLRCVFSSFTDMFFSLSKKEIKEHIKNEILTEDFKLAADNAAFEGKTARFIIKTAKSKKVNKIYRFCRLSFILKYKLHKLFMILKNK